MPKPKSRSSSVASTLSKGKRELVSFQDVVSGNVSEDVLRASSLSQPQEKVYELEHVEGSCQTADLSAVNIAPIRYLTLSASAIHSLRDMSQTSVSTPHVDDIPSTVHVDDIPSIMHANDIPSIMHATETPTTPHTNETPTTPHTTETPTTPHTTETPFPERSEIIKLMKTVTEDSKQFRKKMSIVKDRRQLKAEQKEDEAQARQARNAKMEKRMSEYGATVDEARVLLDNLVTHFQGLSSRYNSEAEEDV